MGLLNYFNCEPLELNFRLLVIGGFWPLQTKVRWQQIMFSVFSFLCYFSETSMIAIQILDLYLLLNDFETFIKDLSIISISFLIIAKSLLFLNQIEIVSDLRHRLIEYEDARTEPEDIEIFKRSNENILKIVKVFYAVSSSCVAVWLVYPGVDSSEENGIPFPYRLPVPWTREAYIGVYVYQSIAMVGYLINIVSTDCIFCGFVLRISSHYEVIIKNVRTLGYLENETSLAAREFFLTNEENEAGKKAETKKLLEFLKKNVQLHQKVLKEINLLKDIFRPMSIVHFTGVTIMIGSAVIDFTKIAKEFQLKLLQRLLFVCIALWDSFLYCFFGSKLQQKSEELALATYGAQWYRLEPEVRRQLMFITARSQRLPQLSVGGLFPLELKTFVRMLRMCFDITAFMYQTTKK